MDVAFGLIVPQEATQEHLNILADIARVMSVSSNKQQLLDAQDASQVIELITLWSQQAAAT